ncbi:MAG: hypothetical protein KIT14_00815 [bacterium]|nr:hypothetical protein [bacterium]
MPAAAGPTRRSATSTRLRGAVLYALYLAVFVVGVAWVAYLRYVHAIRPAHFEGNVAIPGIDAALSSQLGAIPAPDERARAFGNFPREKAPGRIRIGCFGDSFTWGSEVADGNDYPAVLQRLADESGRSDIEVLNFGSPAFGLHQAALLWDRVGRDYALDRVVLLGWARMWTGRDSTFHYWSPPAKKLGFHARYVLAGDGLALAEVVGLTEEERFDAYMRFVPRLRYLRWDRRSPAFLEAWVPPSRTLPNPFYYRDDVTQEIHETYRRLLGWIGREGPNAMLIDIDGLLASLADSCAGPCLPVVRLPPDLVFPYRMPNEHFSPLGNLLVATTVLHSLDPAAFPSQGVIRIGREPVAPDPAQPVIALRDAVEIDVALNDRIVAGLYARPKQLLVERVKRVDRLPPEVRRLLAVVGSDQTLLDAPLLPLPSDAGVPALALEADGTTVALDVEVTPVGPPEVGILRAHLCDAAGFRRALGVDAGAACKVVGRMRELPSGRRTQVRVDGKPAIAVVVNAFGAVTMALLDDAHYAVLPDGDRRPGDPGPGGVVDLRIADGAGRRSRVHVAPFTRVPWTAR